MTPADKLWSATHDAGVDVCFANPGTTEMWLVDGLSRAPVRAILGLHETVCSGAADGYGRLSRKPAAVLLHLGPGLANALANLHNARRASTPVLNLIGTMASWHDAVDPLLNMDVIALARSVSKSVIVTSSADTLPDSMKEAFAATKRSDQAGGSRISTVIIPHDHTWPQNMESLTSKPSRGTDLTGVTIHMLVYLQTLPAVLLLPTPGTTPSVSNNAIKHIPCRLAC